MKNKEKYKKEIFEIACSGKVIAFNEKVGKVTACEETNCGDCLFCETCCTNTIKEWSEAEHIEPMKNSNRDRVFLDYISARYKYIARDKNGILYAYENKPYKSRGSEGWNFHTYDERMKARTLEWLNVDFPMVKWEDPEPWLIEDLKKLEVCEEYETD